MLHPPEGLRLPEDKHRHIIHHHKAVPPAPLGWHLSSESIQPVHPCQIWRVSTMFGLQLKLRLNNMNKDSQTDWRVQQQADKKWSRCTNNIWLNISQKLLPTSCYYYCINKKTCVVELSWLYIPGFLSELHTLVLIQALSVKHHVLHLHFKDASDEET